MNEFLVLNDDGTLQVVPSITFNQSPTSKVWVIATGINGDETFKMKQQGINAKHLGKLSGQDKDFGLTIYASLSRFNWDFNQYPDPSLILLTDTRN